MDIFVLIMVFRAAADKVFFVKAEEGTSWCIFQVGTGKLDSNMAQFSFESLKTCVEFLWPNSYI